MLVFQVIYIPWQYYVMTSCPLHQRYMLTPNIPAPNDFHVSVFTTNLCKVEKEIGERRVISYHGTGVSLAPEIIFHEIDAACGDPDEVCPLIFFSLKE